MKKNLHQRTNLLFGIIVVFTTFLYFEPMILVAKLPSHVYLTKSQSRFEM
jgi:hypothetical protein